MPFNTTPSLKRDTVADSLPNLQSSSADQARQTRGRITDTPAQPSEVIHKKPFRNEIITSPELSDQKLREISNFFRLIFNNDWNEYVVCSDCDPKAPEGMKLSAKEAYDTNIPVPVAMMDQHPRIPDCPCCKKSMQIFHDPEKTFQRLQERLKKEGYVSLLKGSETDSIEGLCYGYGCTLKEQFYSEWGNRFVYMADQLPEHDRSFDHFLKCLNDVFPDKHFNRDTKVFCWNCVAISKEGRGKDNLRMLINNFLDSIPPEYFDLFNVGEVVRGSRWHKILEKGGVREVPDFLDGDETLTGVVFRKSANAFRLPPEQFKN